MPAISSQIETISASFTNLYFNALRARGESKLADTLQKLFEFQNSGDKSYEEVKNFILKNLLKEISLESVKDKTFLKIFEHYAKINDMFRRIRVMANQQFFDMNDMQVADKMAYVLQVFIEKGVSDNDAVQFLSKVQVSTATTSHPTNPNSVSYTRKAMQLMKAVQNYDVNNHQEFANVLDELIIEPISGPKKTQQEEVEEALLYFDEIYDAFTLATTRLAEIAKEAGFEILSERFTNQFTENTLFNFNAWVTGDGDGNPNSTEESLSYNLKKQSEADICKSLQKLKM